jgi:hypothetical protein
MKLDIVRKLETNSQDLNFSWLAEREDDSLLRYYAVIKAISHRSDNGGSKQF